MRERNACLLGIAVVALGGAFLAGAVAGAAWIGRKDGWLSRSGSETLESGVARSGRLELARERERWFTLDVQKTAVALRVKLVSLGTELALDARRGGPASGDDEIPFSVVTDAGEATLAVGRFDDPPLEAGRWSFRVAQTRHVLPATSELWRDEVPFTIVAHVFEARIDGDLAPGSSLASETDPETGGFRSFRVQVPEGSTVLRLDLSDVTSDLDLYARRGAPILSLGEDVRFAQHLYGRETLRLGDDSDPIESGTWYVDVVDVDGEEGPAPFRIHARLASDAPEELLSIPRLPQPSGNAHPVARILSAVVEIATDDALGSGSLISGDGRILTNAHVVERVGGGYFDDVVVSASLDPRRPPLELFRGRIERVHPEGDFAIVRIVSGFYGQPLPEDYAFPTVAIGDPAELSIGDPLWLVGYPSTGGQGSRVTITCTRGVVSGYEMAEFGPLIKTDAVITSGNSGGAAIDERGRIVGVPTSVVELGSGQVAFVHPVSALPAEWRALLRPEDRR